MAKADSALTLVRVVALSVGYTHCPDVCPVTLSELKAAIEALPPSLRPRVQGVFATLDPARDPLPLLRDYLASFNPTGGAPLVGLRGDDADTARLIQQLQLVAERQPGTLRQPSSPSTLASPKYSSSGLTNTVDHDEIVA